MFVSHHTLKWTRTCRSHGRHPHAHTAHFLLNRHRHGRQPRTHHRPHGSHGKRGPRLRTPLRRHLQSDTAREKRNAPTENARLPQTRQRGFPRTRGNQNVNRARQRGQRHIQRLAATRNDGRGTMPRTQKGRIGPVPVHRRVPSDVQRPDGHHHRTAAQHGTGGSALLRHRGGTAQPSRRAYQITLLRRTPVPVQANRTAPRRQDQGMLRKDHRQNQCAIRRRCPKPSHRALQGVSVFHPGIWFCSLR